MAQDGYQRQLRPFPLQPDRRQRRRQQFGQRLRLHDAGRPDLSALYPRRRRTDTLYRRGDQALRLRRECRYGAFDFPQQQRPLGVTAQYAGVGRKRLQRYGLFRHLVPQGLQVHIQRRCFARRNALDGYQKSLLRAVRRRRGTCLEGTPAPVGIQLAADSQLHEADRRA